MLPKSNHINYDALDGFVDLYTHSFSLANLRLPLPNFFCDVLEYFRVHLSRLNLFGCAKLTTFAVICKAYNDEQSVDLFRGFFNLYPGGEWLTFAKRPQADVPTDCVVVQYTRSDEVLWHRCALSFLMDTAYSQSEQFL
ncbi:hypothetical protein Tco_1085726 [Tanacetum coccineum]